VTTGINGIGQNLNNCQTDHMTLATYSNRLFVFYFFQIFYVSNQEYKYMAEC